ncbi:hypothetical protein ACI7BZ_01005 [Xanthobacter sp. AM11]|uniref:hypothetical protein n=1 Tax=Xanthobacter sp. AM11 TaxID=3380643 RepID=UPI0039BF6E07
MALRTAVFSVAIGAAMAFAAPAFAQTATTAQDRMKACSAQWSAAKEAGKVPAGQKWQDFFKECNARLQAGAPAAAPATPAAAPTAAAPTAAAPTAAAPAATLAAPPAAAAAPAAAAPATPQSRMKQCAEEWQALKAGGKVPQGQTWQKYYSECNARLSGAAPAPAAAPAATAPAAPAKPPAAPAKPQAAPAAAPAPAKPAAAPAAKPAASPAASPAAAKPDDDEDTGEGVREPTPGQLAARQRMKDCGAEWRAAKEAGKIPEGQTWPQYWSACNKRLKAAGK